MAFIQSYGFLMIGTAAAIKERLSDFCESFVVVLGRLEERSTVGKVTAGALPMMITVVFCRARALAAKRVPSRDRRSILRSCELTWAMKLGCCSAVDDRGNR